VVISVGATFKTELTRDSGAIGVFLLDLNFTSGHRRFAFWPHDVVYDGNTYEGAGPVSKADVQEQDERGSLTELAIEFYVQNDPSLLEDIYQNSRERFASCYLVFLNPTTLAVAGGEAIYLWRRKMIPGPGLSSQGVYVASVATESVFHTHRNRAPKTYSHAEQQKQDPTDHAFRDAGKNLDLTRSKYVRKSGLAD
jgi:hypothetical protein